MIYAARNRNSAARNAERTNAERIDVRPRNGRND
jgi:hypothetical protein